MKTYLQWAGEDGPDWGEYYRAFFEAIGAGIDSVVAGAVMALAQRSPTRCAEDALGEHARERGIVQGTSETIASWRLRVAGAWTAYVWAGTRRGLLAALTAAGYPSATVAIDREIAFDGTSKWWRFWVVFPAGTHSFVAPAKWGTGTWAWAGVWNSAIPPATKTFLTAVVKYWKPAHAHFMGFIVVHSGSTWGSGTWGSGTWGSNITYEAVA